MNRQQRRKMERGSKEKGRICFLIQLKDVDKIFEAIEMARRNENPDKLNRYCSKKCQLDTKSFKERDLRHNDLHTYLSIPCWQISPPPQSLHLLLRLSCSQNIIYIYYNI